MRNVKILVTIITIFLAISFYVLISTQAVSEENNEFIHIDVDTATVLSEITIPKNRDLLEKYTILPDFPDNFLNAGGIFPPDDRVRITDTTSFPWSSVCKIYMFHPAGYYGSGTGFIIDEFHILTAGHCVYLHQEDGWPYDSWAQAIQVIPAMNDGNSPFGESWATAARCYNGWVLYHNIEHDFSLVTLDNYIGSDTGWMWRETAPYWDPIYSGVLHTAGYPGDLDDGLNMYYCSDIGIGADEYNHYFMLDAAGGQSGSPVWRIDSNENNVLSILTAGVPSFNLGTRFDDNKYNDIDEWLELDSPFVHDLEYSPSSYDFGDMYEGVFDTTTFQIWNEGTGTIAYSLSESCNWCSVSPF